VIAVRVRLAALLVALTLLPHVSACSTDDTDPGPKPLEGNPFTQRPQQVVASPRVVAAALQADADGNPEQGDALRRLAEIPTGVWLTPERYPAGQVGSYVTSVLAAGAGAGTGAGAGRTVPVFVLYGIPDRDCTGTFSGGGLTMST